MTVEHFHIELFGVNLHDLLAEPCPAGFFSYDGFNQDGACRPCPRNHYQGNAQSTSCNRCPDNTYSLLTGQISDAVCRDASKSILYYINLGFIDPGKTLFEKIVRKGENACNLYFLLLLQYFLPYHRQALSF